MSSEMKTMPLAKAVYALEHSPMVLTEDGHVVRLDFYDLGYFLIATWRNDEGLEFVVRFRDADNLEVAYHGHILRLFGYDREGAAPRALELFLLEDADLSYYAADEPRSVAFPPFTRDVSREALMEELDRMGVAWHPKVQTNMSELVRLVMGWVDAVDAARYYLARIHELVRPDSEEERDTWEGWEPWEEGPPDDADTREAGVMLWVQSLTAPPRELEIRQQIAELEAELKQITDA